MEAFEEAGCRGRIHPVPIGRYTDRRGRENRGVLVYRMEVLEVLDGWEESSVRERRIITVREAHTLLQKQDQLRMLARMEEVMDETDESQWLEFDFSKHEKRGEIIIGCRR